MRVDKLLFFLRLTKTRGSAQDLIEAGHVRIDRERVRHTNADVKPGQVLTIALHGTVRIIRVEALPLRRGPAAEAQACYSEIAPPQPIDVHGSGH